MDGFPESLDVSTDVKKPRSHEKASKRMEGKQRSGRS